MTSYELKNIQPCFRQSIVPDKTSVKIDIPDGQQHRYNATDLGTSGAAFPGMYFGNAIQKASEAHNMNTDLNEKSMYTAHIAIVDNFSSKIVDVDGDNIPDLSHGEVVERYLKAENPAVIITRFQIDIDTKSGNIDNASLIKALGDVKKQIDSGEKFDGVNMSLAYEIDLDTLKDLSPANITKAEPVLRERLFNSSKKLNKDQQELKTRIEAIESITQSDVPVYIAAGNNSVHSYNTLGLAKGTTQVGALGICGDTLYARNSDVQYYEQGEYIVGPSFEGDSEVVTGYDINEDGIQDVDKNEVSGKGKYEYYPTIKGTSFSTPIMLGKKTK